MNNLGARVFGLAAVLMGIVGIFWGRFAVEWAALPAPLPGRPVLAYLVAAVLIAGGVLINWPRLSAWGAALLAALFALGLVVFDLSGIARHPLQFAYWDASAEQLAVTAGAVIAYAMCAPVAPTLCTRLVLIGRIAFGLCLFVFGAAHFVYPDLTWPLVPKWLPPSQIFWADFTGAAQIAAGLAIISGVMAPLAARLLTLMYVIFGILVHAKLLLATPSDHGVVMENLLNLALVGAAWIVADSLVAARTSAIT